MREITRKIGEQINSVRRELANLLSIGIITSNSQNNRLYYEVDQTYMHYKPLRDIFSAIDGEAPTSKERDPNQRRFRELGSVKLAYLLGGFVQDPSMQVDLLVVGDLNRAKLRKLIGDLEAEEGRELNYATMTEKEFQYRRDINDRFLADILDAKKSVVIDEMAETVGAAK